MKPNINKRINLKGVSSIFTPFECFKRYDEKGDKTFVFIMSKSKTSYYENYLANVIICLKLLELSKGVLKSITNKT